MEFLKEIWFLLKHVPAVASRYKKKSFWVILFAALSAISRLVKNNFFTSASTTHLSLHWLSLASLVLSGLVFVLAFIDLLRNRISLSDLVLTTVTADAYYHAPDENAYELVERLHYVNRTDGPIANLPMIQDGYTEPLQEFKFEYHLQHVPEMGLTTHVENVDQRDSQIEGLGNLHLYRVSAAFAPALASGDDVDLFYRFSAKANRIEAAVFTPNGTVFARRVEYDTLLYCITIHAPQGYNAYLLGWEVKDADGAKKESETRRQEKPRVNEAKNLITWPVTLARKNLRYMLKYKFESYDWKSPIP